MLRQALNVVASAAPDWLRALAPPEWYERYGRRIENDRLPKGQAARQAYADVVGADGQHLLDALDRDDTPARLKELEAIILLRRVWSTEFQVSRGRLRLREPKTMPPRGELIESPSEPEARFCTKRERHWTGYRVHLTESCETVLPHLITHVETTVASTQDVEQLPAIHAGLAAQRLLPSEHVVDAGYVSGRTLATSHAEYQIDLVGPIVGDHRWQARAGHGFDGSHFQVDWDTRVVTCPQGHRSTIWQVWHTARQRPMIHVAFAPEDCTPCPARSLCTRAKTLPRYLTLQIQTEHEAI
jgi:transposase